MSTFIKTISLLQPWATLAAIGAKKIETRSWSTSYRGPLAIHASARFPREVWRDMTEDEDDPFWRAFRAAQIYEYSEVPRGSVIAVCNLVDCKSTGDVNFGPVGSADWLGELYGRYERDESYEYWFGDYHANRFGWFLSNVRPLPEPIPAKGSLGLWGFPVERLPEEFRPNTSGVFGAK